MNHLVVQAREPAYPHHAGEIGFEFGGVDRGADVIRERLLHLARNMRARRRNLDELRNGNVPDSAGSALRQILLPGGAIHRQTRQQGGFLFRGLISLYLRSYRRRYNQSRCNRLD